MAEIRDELVYLLDDLNKEIPIVSSSLITEDGIVITTSSVDESREDLYTDFATLSASILSMAERGIEIINNNKNLEQIKIDAGPEENRDADFTVLITRVYSNVLLQIVFSKTTNIGLIQYEISKIVKIIRDIIKNDTSRSLFMSLGSLTI